MKIIKSANSKKPSQVYEDHADSEGDVVVIKATDCLEASGNGLRLIICDDDSPTPNLHLAPLIAQSSALRETLLNGRHSSIEAMPKALQLNNGYLTARIRLTFLAPKLIRRILQGEIPVTLSQTRLLDAVKYLPHNRFTTPVTKSPRKYAGRQRRRNPSANGLWESLGKIHSRNLQKTLHNSAPCQRR